MSFHYGKLSAFDHRSFRRVGQKKKMVFKISNFETIISSSVTYLLAVLENFFSSFNH